jgi:hypothetical protein
MSHQPAKRRVPARILMLLFFCALTGCNRDQRTYGKVSGRVTADDQPVVEAAVIFQDSAQHIFIQATTDNDGHYSFDNHPGGGLPIGSYQIAVQPPVQEIRTGEPLPAPKPFPKVDPKYLEPEKSGLSLQVNVGENSFQIALEK